MCLIPFFRNSFSLDFPDAKQHGFSTNIVVEALRMSDDGILQLYSDSLFHSIPRLCTKRGCVTFSSSPLRLCRVNEILQ